MIDSNLLAIVSAIMLVLGFVNGFTFGPAFNLLDRLKELQNKLDNVTEEKLELEEELSNLKNDYNYLLEKYEEYNEIFNNRIAIPLHIPPRRLTLKAPTTPLMRSTHYIDDDSVPQDYDPNNTPYELEGDKTE